MVEAATKRVLSRTVLAAALGYALALHLILSGLAGAVQAAEAFDRQANLDRHALCLGVVGESPNGSGSGPAAHRHDPCCTVACAGAVPLPPETSSPVVFAAAAMGATQSAVDVSARPATPPPGLGRGPRAPPRSA